MPSNFFRSTGSCVAMPTGQVFRWHFLVNTIINYIDNFIINIMNMNMNININIHTTMIIISSSSSSSSSNSSNSSSSSSSGLVVVVVAALSYHICADVCVCACVYIYIYSLVVSLFSPHHDAAHGDERRRREAEALGA